MPEAKGIDAERTGVNGNYFVWRALIEYASSKDKQQYETKKYLDVLKDVCRSYKVAFSVDIEEGGYYHEDGEYTEETSLVLVLIDADDDIVKKIAVDLRRLFNQESVLVTKNRVGGCFIVD